MRSAERIVKYSVWTKLGGYAGGSINHYYAWTFALADLPGSLESHLASIYKMYRLDRVTVKMVPDCTAVTAADWLGAPATFPVVRQSMTSLAIDFDDNIAPVSEADVLRYESCVLHPTFGPTWEVAFEPRAKLDTSNINSVPVKSPWIDTGNTGVTHFGVKVCVPAIGGAVDGVEIGSVYVRYEISLKTVH